MLDNEYNNNKEEYITKKDYEQMETIKLEQDNYAAKILELHSKKIKKLQERIQKLEEKNA